MENAVRTQPRTPVFLGQIYRLAGCSAILSGLFLLAAFVVPGNELSKGFIYSLSPLALLPAMAVLHRLFRAQAPDLSRLALLAGTLGIASILIDLGLAGILRIAGEEGLSPGLITGLQNFIVGFTLFFGLWMVMAGHLTLITLALPPALGTAGIVAGLARAMIISNIVLVSFSTFPQVAVNAPWNLGLVLWISSHIIWTGWLGISLITRRASAIV